MSRQTKEARCYEHQSLSLLKTRNGLSKGIFMSNSTAEGSERQLVDCERCGRVKWDVGVSIIIFCAEGRIEVVSVCTTCAEKGARHETL